MPAMQIPHVNFLLLIPFITVSSSHMSDTGTYSNPSNKLIFEQFYNNPACSYCLHQKNEITHIFHSKFQRRTPNQSKAYASRHYAEYQSQNRNKYSIFFFHIPCLNVLFYFFSFHTFFHQ